MKKKLRISQLVLAGAAMLTLNAAMAGPGSYEFKKEVTEEYANEQPPSEACLTHIGEAKAVTDHQERVDTFIEEKCLVEKPKHFYCWIPSLVERHCMAEADHRTRKSEKMCQSKRDKITTVTYSLTKDGEVVWSGENVYTQTDKYLDESLAEVILSQKEQMHEICTAAKARLIDLSL